MLRPLKKSPAWPPQEMRLYPNFLRCYFIIKKHRQILDKFYWKLDVTIAHVYSRLPAAILLGRRRTD